MTVDLAPGSWEFRDCSTTRWMPAQIPGCVHTDLRRAGKISDPFFGTNELQLQWIEERDWEYRSTFRVSRDLLAAEVVELAADGLDTIATITLNGRTLARTDNMFITHRWSVKPRLRAGRNELRIHFASAVHHARTHHADLDPGEINDPLGRAPAIRKQQCQFGWDWGPRLVTAGIWRGIRLEAWNRNRLEGIRMVQKHRVDGSVALTFTPELARREPGVIVRGTVSMDGREVAQVRDGAAEIRHPALWWPNGHGQQPLHAVDLNVVRADGTIIGRWSRRIGLRTTALDCHPDSRGETFQFIVNGRPIFAKGANWIPAHVFVAGLSRADIVRDLRAAAAAHMNMIRVWGGGIYESEDFYDACDEFGLLVWQDFMFACAIYPADEPFLASVRTEATQQVRRLRHRACLALWCGNNETELLNRTRLEKTRLRRDYTRLFERLLPQVVTKNDGVTPYWPSSPHRPDGSRDHVGGEKSGDTHYWDVWHARHPVKDYEKWRFRFCSEFGMQSYSSPETNATFCPPGDTNVFGPAMENHQKNRGGNQVILDYVSRRYRFPKSQDALIHLSQLNQAYCMQTGVEHYRRHMPHCMGALYWQLNDCWPVASWSSIEFTGRWKALHHAARRFFAPALVCAHVPGEENAGIGNYRHSTVREVHLYTVYDAPESSEGILSWDLFHLDGRVLMQGEQSVALIYGESVRQRSLDLAEPISAHGRESLLLRIALDVGGERVSEETVFLVPPRFLDLPRGCTRASVRAEGPQRAVITFTSPVFQHRFAFDLTGLPHEASDNFFELYPGEPKTVMVDFSKPTSVANLRAALRFHSLADTYAP